MDFIICNLDCSGNLTGANASCTNILSGYCAVFFNFNSLDIGVPFSSGMFVRVAHVITGYLPFTTDFTFF